MSDRAVTRFGRKAVYRVLNLGAGVQSTAVYLMDAAGLLADAVGGRFDAAVMADTQDEPEAVYRHLEWLRTVPGGAPILVRSKGKLSRDLLYGAKTAGRKFSSIPAFTAPDHATRPPGRVREGRIRRQCTAVYKVEVVQQAIRRDVVGLRPRQPFPKGVRVVQYFGISTDEIRRAARILYQFGVPAFSAVTIGRHQVTATPSNPKAAVGTVSAGAPKWSEARFPLIEIDMTRGQCREWLKGRVPHETPRSACVYCPFKTDWEWKKMRDEDPAGWAAAVAFDAAARTPGHRINEGMTNKVYLHRSCVPLPLVDLSGATPSADGMGMTTGECEGMCGV